MKYIHRNSIMPAPPQTRDPVSTFSAGAAGSVPDPSTQHRFDVYNGLAPQYVTGHVTPLAYVVRLSQPVAVHVETLRRQSAHVPWTPSFAT